MLRTFRISYRCVAQSFLRIASDVTVPGHGMCSHLKILVKKLQYLAVICTGLIMLAPMACFRVFKPDTAAVADVTLSVVRSLRGAVESCYEPDSLPFTPAGNPDSVHTDEIRLGVRTTGWLWYENGGTPEDSTDDAVRFHGTKTYTHSNSVHSVRLRVHTWRQNRKTRLILTNIATGGFCECSLGQVDRPGGSQSGVAFWTDGRRELNLLVGICHNETPGNRNDNNSFIEFNMPDRPESAILYRIRADFRSDHSGSGEIHEQGTDGPLVATFVWDSFGRGSLVVNNDIHPFYWD